MLVVATFGDEAFISERGHILYPEDLPDAVTIVPGEEVIPDSEHPLGAPPACHRLAQKLTALIGRRR